MARPQITRPQVGPVVAPQPYQPSGGRVDYTPGVQGPSELAQLAGALGHAAPAVAALGDTLAQRSAESNKAHGEQAARLLAESGQTYADAVKSGKIKASDNPWFHAGLSEQQGRLAADKFGSDMLVVAQQGLRTGEIQTLDQWDQIAQAKQAEWLAANVKPGDRTDFFESGFGRNKDAQLSNIRREVASQVEATMQRTQGEQQQEEVYNATVQHFALASMDAGTALGAAVGVTGKQPDLVATINHMNQNALALNPTAGRIINKATIDGIVAYAREHNSPQALDLLKRIDGGPGSKLGNTAYGMQEVGKAQDAIAAQIQRDAIVAEEQRKKAVLGIYQQGVSFIQQNPTASISDYAPFESAMTKVAPDQVDNLRNTLRKLQENHDYPENFDVKRALYLGIYTDKMGAAEINAAFDSNQINSTTYTQMQGILNNAERIASGSAVIREGYLSQGLSRIDKAMNDWLGVDPAVKVRAARAQAEFSSRYIQWRTTDGAGKTPAEIQEWAVRTQEDVMRRWAGGSVASALIQAQPKEGAPAAKPPVVNVDPTKGPTAGGQMHTELVSELADFVAGRRARLSDHVKKNLYDAGVDFRDIRAVTAYLAQQKLFIEQAQQNPDSLTN